MSQKLTIVAVILAICAISLWLFKQSLNYYFFQDDWFVLNWIKNSDLASLFSFRSDIIYWRPTSMPLFFKLSNTLFNLNPIGYHVIAFLVHVINIILVFLLFRNLKFTTKSSLFSAFLYATAAFHFMPLSWLSTTSYIIGPTFIFATLILLRTNRKILSMLSFILALSASEFALTAVPIYLILGGKFTGSIKKVIPFITIALIYLILRFFIFQIPTTGTYQISLNFKILSNLFWYFAWMFNIPEQFSTIIFPAKPLQSYQASREFFGFLLGPIITFILFSVVVIWTKLHPRQILKGSAIFLSGLLPVILLPQHSFPMYLIIASLGFIYIFTQALEKSAKFKTPLAITIIIVWLISSYQATSFNRHNHWLVNEQSISRAYTNYTKEQVPNPQNNSIFIFRPAYREFAQNNNFIILDSDNNLRQSLNNQDATQVIYNNPSLRSVFVTDQQQLSIPESINTYEIRPGAK